MVRYFDLDGDDMLNYHDFLQILLPCDNPFLRSAATQRPNQEIYQNEFLPMRVERAMSQLIFKEVKLHLKAENIKRSLETSYDFSVRSAFKAIDDWNYNYIDKQNLKRFLRSMGHLANKHEIVAILRRFDLDGDAKINLKEFGDSIKTQLACSNPVKLRNIELEKERQKSQTGGSYKSAKRNSSVTCRGDQPMSGFDASSQGYSRGQVMGGPSPILKSGKGEKKKRPKTAERNSSFYNPNRGVIPSASYGANQMANPGINFSPYQVPNVAKIPQNPEFSTKGKAGKQVSFGKQKNELPTNLIGMNHLRDSRDPGGSPLRE